MSQQSAALRAGLNNGLAARAIRFARQTLAIAEADVRKLLHDPTELATRMVQPALWLLIFGQVLARARAIPTGPLPYLDFIAPGILAQSVLFMAIFYGISLIWERDLGIVHKYLVSPAARSALVLGRAISAAVRALSQAVVIYLLSALLGVDLHISAAALIGVVATIALGAGIFSTFSLIIACLVRTRERFMGIGQLMTMPLFFASNAIYPLDLMPGWLRVVSTINPLSYQVDALRSLMIGNGHSHFGLPMDFGVQIIVFFIVLAVATRMYPNIIN